MSACDGSASCQAAKHIHGCYAETYGARTERFSSAEPNLSEITYDSGTKNQTTILVYTDDDVTPDFLAMRIAQSGVLRPGESAQALGSENRFITDAKSLLEAIEEDLGGPLFGGSNAT